MKRVCGFLVVVACILFLAGFAQAVDIVSFMGMKAGRWNQYAMSENCGNPKDDWGQKVVKTSEGNFIWKYYQKENSIWVYQDADIFKVEATKLKMLGSMAEDGTWLYTPAVSISRSQPLNTPFIYKGAAVNQTSKVSIPVFMTLTITENPVTVATPAGTFTNCIQLVGNTMSGTDVVAEITFLCQGRGKVKAYKVHPKKSADQENPIDVRVTERDLEAFGDSKPPF